MKYIEKVDSKRDFKTTTKYAHLKTKTIVAKTKTIVR